MSGDSHGTVAVTVVVAPPRLPTHLTGTGHPTQARPTSLPFTGAPIDLLSTLAVAGSVVGAAIVALARRRSRQEPT